MSMLVSSLKLRAQTPPAASTAGKVTLYADASGAVGYVNSSGTDTMLVGNTTAGGVAFGMNDLHLYCTAGVPVDYTDGTPPATGEAVAGPGSLCIDRTNSDLYINTGTKAQPLWTKPA